MLTRKKFIEKYKHDCNYYFDGYYRGCVIEFLNQIYDSFEKAMKPKTCEGCSNLFFDEIEKVYKCSNDVSDDVGYLHGEAVIRNIKDFHCVQHQPKDNA